MRKLIFACLSGILAAFVAMLFGENQPAFGLQRLLNPGNPLSGFDIYVHDHYFIFNRTLFRVNFVIFGAVVSALLELRPADRRRADA
jgi:hypothetical protein